jgi:hypothetical protein
MRLEGLGQLKKRNDLMQSTYVQKQMPADMRASTVLEMPLQHEGMSAPCGLVHLSLECAPTDSVEHVDAMYRKKQR